MRRLTALIMLALATVACLGSDFADSLEGSWQLTTGTVDGEQIHILDSHPITITFEDDQVSGTASCNGYAGTYELVGSEITFSDMASTAMACIPEEAMTAEQTYLDGLTLVSTIAVDEGLKLDGDGVSLVFEALAPVPVADLTGTVWILDGLISGDAASSVSGEPATLELFTDGSVLGSTGCRNFAGQYVLAGAEVVITEMTVTGQPCEPDLADQDSHVLRVLGDGFTVEVDGPSMTAWSVGDIGLMYRSA